MVIVVWAYHHIPVDASNHYAPEPSVVFPTVILVFNSADLNETALVLQTGLEPVRPRGHGIFGA